jgi:hypothetical protein
LLALVLAACSGQPGTMPTARKPAAASTAPSTAPSPVQSHVVEPSPATRVVTLAGSVRGPAALVSEKGNGIISDNAGGIISDNAGGIVSNNGGGFRLTAAPDQVPVAGARVVVLDAAGKPVPGLVATTDAKGAYAFTQPLPADNMVVSVDLGTHGSLAAIAPTGGTKADVDLVSTLTTGYILDQYVKGDAKVLDKLPADVEADTRAKAAGAVAGGKVPLPDDLTPAKIVATVEALRKADPTLDAQMDAVKRLLIPAGQADLGTGQLATAVDLGQVLHLAVTPGGELLMATQRMGAPSSSNVQARIWRLGKDGRLAVAVDDQSPYVKPAAGSPGFDSFGLDASGALLILSAAGEVGRIGADGQVTTLATVKGARGPVWVDAQGKVWSIARKAQAVAVVRPDAGPGKDSPAVATDSAVAFAADGQATVYDQGSGKRHTYDAGANAWTTAPFDAGKGYASLDPAGRLYEVDPSTRVVSQQLPDGSLKPLATLPAEADLQPVGGTIDFNDLELSQIAVCGAPDGSAFMVDFRGRVYHLANGRATHVAGLPAKAGATGDANAVSLQSPVAVVALPNGDVLVGDEGRKQVLRVTPDHKIAIWGGSGQEGLATEGQALKDAPLSGLVRLAVDGQDVYLMQETLFSSAMAGLTDLSGLPGLGKSQLLRIGADGIVHVAARIDNTAPTFSNFVRAGGKVYVRGSLLGGIQVLEAGALTSINLGAGASPADAPTVLAGDPTGPLWLFQGPKTLLRCAPPSAPEAIVTDDRLAGLSAIATNPLRGVVDAKGRVCMVDPTKNCVWRFDPADKSFTVLAGQGGPIFAGSTPDDSLGSPKDLAFAADGALLVLDGGNKQVKRIPPDKL